MHVHEIETFLLLLGAVTLLAWAASALRIAYPIFLVLGGSVLAFTPGLPLVELHPDVVFLLILPPILYQAALVTSWRDFKANARPIAMLAIGLVLITTFAVAAVARLCVPELPWSVACMLGAIVSPPDAVAATAITRRLNVPRRIVTILEGESLVNDATALVAYRFAIAATVTGAFSLYDASLAVPMVALGGVLVGLVAGVLSSWLRRFIEDESVQIVAALLTPYLAYLPAEKLHVSGVLAAVTAGIYVARANPRAMNSRTRLRLIAIWEALIFLLNGIVFILIGLQLPGVLVILQQKRSAVELLTYVSAISLTAIVVRIGYVYVAATIPRAISAALRARDPLPPSGQLFLIGWTGMRGVVSLAAALAVPRFIESGAPFPYRDLVIFITFGVIMVTLVLQGLSLPALVRALRIPRERDHLQELALARYETAHAAIARLETLLETDAAAPDLIERLRVPYEERIQAFAQHLLEERDDAPLPAADSLGSLRREALTAERQHLIEMRDDGLISDDALREVMEELDLAEAKLIH